jgi:hypothetical protein
MKTKILVSGLILLAILIGCKNQPQDSPSLLKEWIDIEIIKDTRELIMQATEPWESSAIGYYKVIKISDSLWYMWYQAWETDQYYGNRICFAYSEDGKNWKKEIPGQFERKNNVLMNEHGISIQGWVEIDAFVDPNDSIYPYRILYNKRINYNQKTYLAKSRNGWDWIDEKLIFDSFHDSQFSVHVLKNGNYLTMLRLWDEGKKSGILIPRGNKQESQRIIGQAIIKPSGEIVLSPTVFLKSNHSEYLHLYTSATTIIDDNEYIMFPTFYNSIEDKMILKSIYYHAGKAIYGKDVTLELYQNDPVEFGIVSPGLIPAGPPNEYWLYYYRQVQPHNNAFDRHFSNFYYRIKVKLLRKKH